MIKLIIFNAQLIFYCFLYYSHFFYNTRKGRTLRGSLEHGMPATNDIIFKRVQKMHSGALKKYRSTILSLVAGIYPASELKRANFQFSRSQLNTACRKAREDDFSLENPRRVVIPSSRRPTPDETVALVEDILRRYSRSSCTTLRRNTIHSNFSQESSEAS